MTSKFRKLAAGALALLVALTPSLTLADGFPYFRMYGGGFGGPSLPFLTYQVSGATTSTVGQNYQARSLVSGASGAVRFSISSGSLASGLTLDAASGAIGGTPSLPGSYQAVLEAVDANGTSGRAQFDLSVSQPLTIAGSPVATATVGQAYTAAFAPVGGRAPYTFSTQAQLPPGLSLDILGSLSGVPTLAGNYSGLLISAADADGRVATSAPFAIRVENPLTIAWTPAPGQVGKVYSPAVPQAAGGRSPYSYTLTGSIPDGLSFGVSTGLLSGTPIASGTFPLTLIAMDAEGRIANSGQQQLTIAPGETNPGSPLSIAALPATAGQTGVAYLSHVAATGGIAPYAYSIASGSLPPGLSLDPASGAVSGTPSLAGSYGNIVFTVSDMEAGVAKSSAMTMIIASPPPLLIAGSPSSEAQVGSPYSAQFTAFDGSGSGYHFTSIGGALPPGLQLSDVNGVGGSISGVPAHVGTYSGLQIRVTDSLGNVADSNVFSITVQPIVGPALALVGEPQPYSDIGQSYLATFGATGGTATGYVFDLAAGALPTGLTFSQSGTLSGTTTTAETANFTVRVTDSSGETALKSFSISVGSSLVFETPTLPDGTWGATYTYALKATGGVAPYRFSYTGSFPPGITLDPALGLISGSSSQGNSIQTFPISVSVLDTIGRVATKTMSLTMYSAATFAPFTPPSGAVGEPYSYVPQGAQGGSGHFTYQVLDAATSGLSTALSSIGLSLDPVSGAITGTPTKSGSTVPLIARATDTVRGTNNDRGPWTIFIADSLAIAGAPPATVTVGVAYSGSLNVSGGSGGYSFTIASGTLPPWLSFDATTGAFFGTPQTSDIGKIGPIQVAVTDIGGATAISSPFEIQVLDVPMTATASLVSGAKLRTGAAITGTLSSNRSSPTWSFTQSPPTPDLGLAGSGSTFSGVAPVVTGKTSFTFAGAASSSDSTVQTSSMSIDVAGPFSVHGGIAGTGGTKVGLILNASASSNLAPQLTNLIGTATYALKKSGAAFSLSSQCPGLSIDSSSGMLTGSPTAACDTGLTLTMTITDAWDGASATTTNPFGILVTAPPAAPTGNFTASATAGTPYTSGPLAVTGGIAPYTWTAAGGALPGGLTLNPSTGVVAGTPNAAGTFTFAVRVTDSSSNGATSPGSAWQTITVADATFSVTPTLTTVHSGQPFSGALSTSIISPTVGMSPSPSTPSLSLAIAGSGTTWIGRAPTVGSSTPFTVTWTATTSDGTFSKTATTSVNVIPPLAVSGGATGAVSGQVGAAITQTPSASASNLLGSQSFALWQGGTAISLPNLCPGLTFTSSNAVIQGTPTAACSLTNLTIVATDSADGTTASQPTPFSISITVPVNLTIVPVSNSFSNVTNGAAFSTSATVSGGSGSYSSAKIVSSQIKGLTASISGNRVTISGSPLVQFASGGTTFTVQVTDTESNTGSSTAVTLNFSSAPTGGNGSIANTYPDQCLINQTAIGTGGTSVACSVGTFSVAQSLTAGKYMQLNYSGGAVRISTSAGAVSASPSGSVTAYYWNGESWVLLGSGGAGVASFSATVWTNKVVIFGNSGTTTSRYWYAW
jgi:hypothetical protein